MRRSRQALIALAIAGVASAACLVLIVILASRDESGVGGGNAPGTLEPDRGARHLGAGAPRTPVSPPGKPPTSGPHRPVAVTRDAAPLSEDQLLQALELGNVVIAYDAPEPPAALRELQRDVAGEFTPELADAGQAVILDRRPGVNGPVALAWRRRLVASSPTDPQLRAFAEAWLALGAG